MDNFKLKIVIEKLKDLNLKYIFKIKRGEQKFEYAFFYSHNNVLFSFVPELDNINSKTQFDDILLNFKFQLQNEIFKIEKLNKLCRNSDKNIFNNVLYKVISELKTRKVFLKAPIDLIAKHNTITNTIRDLNTQKRSIFEILECVTGLLDCDSAAIKNKFAHGGVS